MNRKQRRAEKKQMPAGSIPPSADPTLHAMFVEAVRLHQTGRLAEAEQLYRRVLNIEPRHPHALHSLGILAHQFGRDDIAADLIAQAIGHNGQEPSFHNNLGNALKALGRLDEAMASYRRALRYQPNYPEAHNNLGIALQAQGKLEEAEAAYRAAVAQRGDYAEVHGRLGNVLKERKKFPAATAAYRYALILRPDNAEVLGDLGILCAGVGQRDEAVAFYSRAAAVRPDLTVAHYNLGLAYSERGEFEAAVASFGRALQNKPTFAEAHGNLGIALKAQGKLAEAAASYANALRHRGNYAEAHYNLGNVLTAQGKLAEAISSYERALVHKPAYPDAAMNLAYVHLYRPGVRLEDVLLRARRWSETYAAGLPRLAHAIGSAEASSQRARLPRVGFISADFRSHAVGFLVIPAIEGLARAGYHLTLYSNNAKTDDVTARFVKAATRWREVIGLSDTALAEQIRDDGIDILIDLSGYTDGNRLLALARKPAPLQVAGWIGYPATTGLAAVDYVLADRYHLPAGAEPYYSEAVVRLPDSYVAFEPPSAAPPVGDPPCLGQNGVTFGSFNTLTKITADVVAAWSQILVKVPGSRLLIKSPALDCPGTRQYTLQRFVSHGIDAERLQLVGGTSPAQHLAWMQKADIALDTFPYAGGRTTVEALWMGLPVITLPGETFGSRHSLSYLSTIGLGELVADSVDHYVERAVMYAEDKARLAAMRSGLRDRILASPLCDVDRFTGHLSTALTGMWRRWCDGQPPSSFDVT